MVKTMTNCSKFYNTSSHFSQATIISSKYTTITWSIGDLSMKMWGGKWLRSDIWMETKGLYIGDQLLTFFINWHYGSQWTAWVFYVCSQTMMEIKFVKVTSIQIQRVRLLFRNPWTILNNEPLDKYNEGRFREFS